MHDCLKCEVKQDALQEKKKKVLWPTKFGKSDPLLSRSSTGTKKAKFKKLLRNHCPHWSPPGCYKVPAQGECHR